MIPKEIYFGNEARKKIKNGIEKVYNAVAATLGPKGRNLLIEYNYSTPILTKDGVTVAKSIDLEDKAENMGAQLVKQVANRTNDVAGDRNYYCNSFSLCSY